MELDFRAMSPTLTAFTQSTVISALVLIKIIRRALACTENKSNTGEADSIKSSAWLETKEDCIFIHDKQPETAQITS